MIYLTWGTGYTGIFASQVVDVLNYVNSIQPCNIKLVCFVPYTGFFKTRQTIIGNYKNSIVLPMVPSRNRWWPLYAPLLYAISLLCGETSIMARGVIACNLALSLKRKGLIKWVCYDGRGAEKAEWNEYNVVNDPLLEKEIAQMEQDAVNRSNFRLGVSGKLVEYWEKEYGYCSDQHVVIPCTIKRDVYEGILNSSDFMIKRKETGFNQEDIIIVYSGGADHWQSFSELDLLLQNILSTDPKIKILFLSNFDLTTLRAFQLYKARFTQKWVNPTKVSELLNICDYGLLYRHNSVTNKVAAPTKFAEYLACGLKIIISPNVGDYSTLVTQYKLGVLVRDINQPLQLNKNCFEDRKRISDYGRFFTKAAYHEQYQQILKNAALYK